jgi:hypothetical protein
MDELRSKGMKVELIKVARKIMMNMFLEALDLESGLVNLTITSTNSASRILVADDITEAPICIPLVSNMLFLSCEHEADMV